MNVKQLILYITLAAGVSKALEKGCVSAERAAVKGESAALHSSEKAALNATARGLARQNLSTNDPSAESISSVEDAVLNVKDYLTNDLTKENKNIKYESSSKTFFIDNTK